MLLTAKLNFKSKIKVLVLKDNFPQSYQQLYQNYIIEVALVLLIVHVRPVLELRFVCTYLLGKGVKYLSENYQPNNLNFFLGFAIPNEAQKDKTKYFNFTQPCIPEMLRQMVNISKLFYIQLCQNKDYLKDKHQL